jgi:NAD(P)-dependent dehydrogenase (short-subunit alcohol dehydrogenase family)
MTVNMRVLLVGATGVVGRAVARMLKERHEIVEASRTRADNRVDITEDAGVRAFLDSVGALDAIVSAAGEAHFGPFATTSPEAFEAGVRRKLVGQVRLVLAGQSRLRDGGSFTLTSGMIGRVLVAGASNAATVNAGLEAFVCAACAELPRGLRVNAVSPSVLADSWQAYGRHFPGLRPVDAERVADAYRRSVEGSETGQVYAVH